MRPRSSCAAGGAAQDVVNASNFQTQTKVDIGLTVQGLLTRWKRAQEQERPYTVVDACKYVQNAWGTAVAEVMRVCEGKAFLFHLM